MKKYNAFHIPFMSFYSRALYCDMAKNWSGTCFLYMLLLLTICWLPIMIKMQSGIAFFVNHAAPEVVEQLPTISIKDGRASFNVPQPHVVKTAGSDAPLIVFDSSGKYVAPDDAAIFAMVTATGVIIKRHNELATRSDEYKFDDIPEFTLTPQMVTDGLEMMRKYLVLILSPFALIFSYLFRIIQALIYAAIGLLFASWCKTTISYDKLIRLAVAAVTPVIIVTSILDTAGINIPFVWVLAFLAAMGYLYFGVSAVAREEKAIDNA